MSVKQVDYKGKKIIYVDYRGLTKIEQHIQNVEELNQAVKESKTPVLILSNFESVSVGSEYMNRVKEAGKENQSKIKAQAVLGVTGLKNILLQGYITFTGEKNMKTFDSETEAMDWLVSS